ncbi:MAG TPA: aminotransferase class III-fold pyridoxal phosphate-dependent enzyme [Trueperaceae bacterium]|nr:aminotransferase class III-fold pyridoxal phosphate-dependent enzyme [Trueperaceae bacterium]
MLSGTYDYDPVAVETRLGNGDLITLLDILGIGGPFTVQSPWELRDPAGRHLIHAGGYAAVPFGEGYPPLVEFVRSFLSDNRQLGFPQQSSSEWRAALESNLVALLSSVAPSHSDSHVFFTNSGAEAIEAAIKMARAHKPDATLFINFAHAYHGKTLGALALTPSEEYQALFRPLSPDVLTLPYGDEAALVKTLSDRGKQVVAIVVEPVQGEGGVISPPDGYLRRVGELAKQHGVLVLADEIQTGLGRAGSWFASVTAGLEPDIITLAKPLGGGMVPIGAVIARKAVFRSLLPGLASKRHSNTFGGGSLAVAVGLKSLELLVDERLDERSARLGVQGLGRLHDIAATYPSLIQEVRGAGMLFALTLKPMIGFKVPGVSAEDVQTFAAALGLRALHEGGVHGCYSTNANRVVRLTPPLNMPEELFTQLFDRVEQVAKANPRSLSLLQRFPVPRLLRLARVAFG